MQKIIRPLILLLSVLVLNACSSEPIRKKHIPLEESEANATVKPNLVAKAQALYQKNNIKGANQIMEQIQSHEISLKERSEYWNLKGLLALHAKKYDLATQNFRRALEENLVQDYRGYYQYNLATSLNGSENHQESFEILSAIDLSSIDQPQRNKVLFLKEKVSKTLDLNKGKSAAKDDSGSNSQATANPSPNGGLLPAPTPDMIVSPEVVYTGTVNRKKIGLLIPLSGKYETFGKKVQRAVELVFQHSSDSNARDYELVVADSGDNAESQLKALTKLVEEDLVIGIIGPVISKGIEVLAKKAVFYQVPLITLAQIQSPLASHLFFCSVSTKDQASQVVQHAMTVRGYRKFALIAPSNKPGEEMANSFKDEVIARNGEIAHMEYYEPNITDFRTPVDKILGLSNPEKRKAELDALAEKRREMNITRKTTRTAQYYNLPPIIDFDAVFIADEAKIAGQIIPTFTYRDAKNLQFLGVSSWNSSQLVQRAQDQVEDAVFPVAFNTIKPNDDTKSFFDLYSTSYNSSPGELDAISFDAASLVIKAMKSAPSTRDELRLSIEAMKNVQGATGEFSVEDHRCSRTLNLVRVYKGKFEIINEDQP